ncbi:MAG TPA: RagB/SusD family nutrient uptake outer membrane protein, partial [Bacteroidales bacterium]|nr:RagB/SusD family nutrient uptake outer membrane protein [Bacteroidales bacterium]
TAYFTGYGNGYTWGNYFTGGPWSDEYSSSAIWTQNPATSGNGWGFTYVRRANIMIDRVEKMPVSDEAKNHWRGIGRFYRAMEYSDLARTFGDVPWFDKEIFPADVELSFKERDPLPFVATKIMEDFQYAADNVRVNDGAMQINKDVVLAFMSRNLLYFGTYLKYHNLDQTVATALLEKAKWAADQLITGGKYQVADDYRGLFTSNDLTGNKEVIFFRQYEVAKSTHCIVAYNNQEPQTGTTLKMVETYLSNDGLPIKQSPVYNYASDNGLRYYPDQCKNRDPRMAATLVDSVRINQAHTGYSTTGFPCLKFLPYTANATDLIYQGSTSVTDAPVIRYGEVLLNYAEAAAELGQFTQADADKTINKLRNRNIKKNNTGSNLTKLPAMVISGNNVTANGVVINDPDRDPSVSPLLWEIRRERCVELMFEGFRKNDLRRWMKFEYLKTKETAGPTTLGKGAYVDLSKFPVATRNKITAAVRFYYPDPAGAPLKAFIYNLYDANMRRDWIPGDSYYERQYLNSVPLDQIKLYSDMGYVLTQNPGWEQ